MSKTLVVDELIENAAEVVAKAALSVPGFACNFLFVFFFFRLNLDRRFASLLCSSEAFEIGQDRLGRLG